MTVTREQAWPLFDKWYSNHGWKYISSRECAFLAWKAGRYDLEAKVAAKHAFEWPDVKAKIEELEATIAEQAKEIERLKLIEESALKVCSQIDEVVIALPFDYLDPPDGGDVSIGEQVRRMYEEVKTLRHAVVSDHQQLQASQAREAQLREACDLASILHEAEDTAMPHPEHQSLRQCSVDALSKALSIQPDDSALREYGAKLVEKISGMTLSTYALKQIANQLREGTFK